MKKLLIFVLLMMAIAIGYYLYYYNIQAQPLKGLEGKIVFKGSIATFKGDKPAIGVYDFNKNKETILYTETTAFEPRVSPDGKRIVYYLFDSNNIYSIPITGGSKEILLDSQGNKYGYSIPSWDFSGSSMVYSSGADDKIEGIYLKDTKTNVTKKILDDKYQPHGPEISPYGKKIAFVGRDPIEAKNKIINSRLYVMNLADGVIVNIGGPDGVTNYNWSPDSKKICYISDKDDQIHVANIDGSNDKAITNLPSHGWSCAWSPDGTKIVFDYIPPPFVQAPTQIYIINADGTCMKRFYPRGRWTSISSPQWVASKENIK